MKFFTKGDQVQMIAFVGGTGIEGRGLALRMAMLGNQCLLGSRDSNRATSTVKDLLDTFDCLEGFIEGGSNQQVSELCELAFITLPYDALRPTLVELKEALSDKLVISTVVPLEFSRSGVDIAKISQRSAASEIQKILCDSYVVSAFQNVSAQELLSLSSELDCDVIVCGDNYIAKRKVIQMVNLIDGLRGLDGGVLANSWMVENITAMLVTLNRIHQANTSIKIIGI